ncbi:hypothetical protein KO02_12240 [Sphingobacterium sp. ML3W]|uniref:hypothetical protein n=1 Tax=Sphingobacterium sp. ML3W TaxID=1538644 RepID=UPI0004F7DA76|nr:hypothetical protein [Sphingobacterium sp. ML3W]AIM37374.1 hypothetical protein KO02_12240 [Sphingobacterium sp. ML3W]
MSTIIVQNMGINRIPVTADLESTGWSISNGSLVHKSGKSGFAINMDLSVVKDISYTIRYTIKDFVSGEVFIIVGGTGGNIRTSNGTYEETILSGSDGSISFFSSGEFSITNLSIVSGTALGETLVFSEKGLKWVGSYGFVPDEFIRYKGLLFSYHNGAMYEHNISNIRNEFYGTKYPSKIRFISNKDYPVNKVFFGIKIDSVGTWQVDLVKTNKTDQFPNGMQSRLPKKNIKLLDGKYWADFFRDMNDPAFANIIDEKQRELTALNDGRILQGNYLEIQMSCDTDEEMKLISVSVYSSEVGRN